MEFSEIPVNTKKDVTGNHEHFFCVMLLMVMQENSLQKLNEVSIVSRLR